LHRRSSFLGLIVPLMLLAGQLSVVVHAMAVEHQRCPEHGELIHRVSPATSPVLPDAGHQSLTSLISTERHGHDHCVSLIGRRDGAGPPPRPSTDLAPATEHGALAWAARLCGDDRGARLSLAPKTSPPLPV
jgi:hypothetical protein